MPRVECALSETAGSVGLSRDIVRRVLGASPSEFVHNAMLLTDELVTNAIRHGQPPIVLSAHFDGLVLTIDVVDSAPGLPVRRTVNVTDDYGRGLEIVDRLSDEWGVDPMLERKRVWFRLVLDGTDTVRATRDSRSH